MSSCVRAQEFTLSEPAEVLMLIDGDRESNKICVGFRGQFELLDESTEDVLRLFRTDATPKVCAAAAHRPYSLAFYLLSLSFSPLSLLLPSGRTHCE